LSNQLSITGWAILQPRSVIKHSAFLYFKTSPEVILSAVMVCVQFPLYPRNVENLLHEQGIDVRQKTVHFWLNRFGPMFASEIAKKRCDHAQTLSWVIVANTSRASETIKTSRAFIGSVRPFAKIF
tara:strand:+ start:123 stop:500 length:378 start_codon:yes stop_codon:yes gene_type:complete